MKQAPILWSAGKRVEKRLHPGPSLAWCGQTLHSRVSAGVNNAPATSVLKLVICSVGGSVCRVWIGLAHVRCRGKMMLLTSKGKVGF